MSPNLKTILIADDSDFDRKIVSQLLQRNGYHVVEAVDGLDCLEKLQEQPVDLCILDIEMPKMSGVEALVKIRETQTALTLPIIMNTAKSEVHNIVEAFDKGANDYVTKPVNTRVVLKRVANYIELARLVREQSRMEQLETVASVITTYHHEIRNPLTIAITGISRLRKTKTPEKQAEKMDKIERALWRVNDVLKKIAQLTESELSSENYDQQSKILKLGS